MYQRDNSPEFNSKALIKTGMRDAGASIINGMETPTPVSHLPTQRFRSNQLTPLANPSFITHSHSKPNFSDMNTLDHSREERNYSSLMKQNTFGSSRRVQGTSHPHLKSRAYAEKSQLQTIDNSVIDNPYQNKDVSAPLNKAIDKTVQNYHMLSDSLRLAEDNQARFVDFRYRQAEEKK